MKEILFLPHRLPYPPNKGDKIRSFNILKFLSQEFRVHLGTFVDDSEDMRYLDEVRELCAETCFIEISTKVQRIKSLRGLLTGQALSIPYYKNTELGSWVRTTNSRKEIEAVLVFSSSMGQYLDLMDLGGRKVVIDFVDVDSAKWRQYSLQKNWPLSWVYRREAGALAREEHRLAALSECSTFVSEAEAALFARIHPESAGKVTAIPNGVDTEYFDPALRLENPFPPGTRPVVFTGAMDYWANEDAVRVFSKEVWPAVLDRVPEAQFFIVGARPTPGVLKLGQVEGIVVTGAVADIRPYLAHAVACVAPMRIARGVQNKVLEALAMARPVLATEEAAEGIAGVENVATICADVEKMQSALIDMLSAASAGTNSAGRKLVVENFSWSGCLKRLAEILQSRQVVGQAGARSCSGQENAGSSTHTTPKVLDVG